MIMNHFHQMLTAKSFGGANRIALNLTAALRDRGDRSHVWIPGEGPAKTKAEEMGLTWSLYDPTGALAASRLGSTVSNWTLGRQLYSYRPGLVHVHTPHFYRALLPALKVSRLKTVVHVQLEEEQSSLRWALKTPPAVIITCARFLVDQVRSALPEHLQGGQSIVAVPNAVNTDQFHPGDKHSAKQKVGAPQKIPLILLVANLAPHKGHETGIRTMAILKQRGVDAGLWFAGVERGDTVAYTERLKTLCGELGVADRVRFLGQRSDVPELLRAADCVILPSTAEGLPLSILEAQATKVPVLAAPTAGIPEIIVDEKTGILVRADDFNAYAHHLVRVLTNPVLRSQIVDTAYSNILREYSWKTFIGRVYGVYQSVINN
jgi:glycosyltransferase involved in cell wall biosynthesis